MITRHLCLALLVVSSLPLSRSQVTQAVKPVPPERQLDFWIGEWELTGKQRVAPDKEEWREMKATNSIHAKFKGNVIEEHFSMPGFEGGSVSVFDRATKTWKQTWVDDQGSYLDFTGECQDGRMTFSRKVGAPGTSILQRMVFHDIQPDSLTWDWETSRDEGKSWRLMWQLSYRRKTNSSGAAKTALAFLRSHIYAPVAFRQESSGQIAKQPRTAAQSSAWPLIKSHCRWSATCPDTATTSKITIGSRKLL
jgi:hypothetical protein